MRVVRRIPYGGLIVALALVLIGVAVAASAGPPLAVTAGETVSIRLSPPRQAARVYLAPSSVVATIRSRNDRRLHLVGVLPRGRRTLTFTVPPLDSGRYDLWCSGCPHGVQLRVRTPTTSCPVTLVAESTIYSNGLLSTGRLPPDGTVVVDPSHIDERGLFWTKLGWAVRPGSIDYGDLVVVVRRLDVAAPARVVETVRGDNWWSWAARMRFPDEGCYRVTGRVEDIALSFVVRVVVG
jgi:hypothetical protein